MKTLLCTLAICVALTSACKKSQHATPESPKTQTTFTVADFSQTVVPMGKSGSSISDIGDTLKNYADYLIYRVYNSSGTLVSSKDQTSSSPTFGTITDRLEPGNYTVLFVASKDVIGYQYNSLASALIFGHDPGFDWVNDVRVQRISRAWEDTFLKKISITVGTDPFIETVRLDRIVGALELNLEAGVPAEVAKITISVEYDQNTYQVNTGVRSSTLIKTKEFTVTDSDRGQPNKKFLMHVFNVTRPQLITIKGFNTQNELVTQKVINNVTFFQNKKTILTGNLNVSSTFIITVNPVWDEPHSIIKI